MASSSSSRAALRLFKGSSSASRLPLRRCLTSDAARGAEAAGDGGAPDEALTNAIATLSAKAAPKVAPQVDEEARRRALRKTMLNNLSSLPSTQTRENTWRPAHARLTPVTARELTVSHLLAATAHVGHNVTHLNRAAEGLVYGTRHKVAYIDVERFTLPALKRAAKVVRDTVWRDGVVLFCGTMPGTQAAVLAAAKRLGPNGFHVTQERWMPGVLTNAPKILARATASGMDAYTAAMRERRDRTSSDDRLPSRRAREEEPDPTQLATQELQPDLLVVLNPKANLHALREATARGIATIAVTDTDVDPRICTYAIPANDESVRTAELIVGVLSKAGEEGRRQRLSDIETFKKKQARERQQRIRTQPRYAPRKVE